MIRAIVTSLAPFALVASVSLVALLAPAHGESCADATTQARMNECAGQDFEAADKTLNTTYKSVMDRLRGQEEARRMLVAAQRYWIAFRDGECAFEASGTAGGSIHPMIVTQCKTDFTRHRAEKLQKLLDCREGDLACPLPPK